MNREKYQKVTLYAANVGKFVISRAGSYQNRGLSIPEHPLFAKNLNSGYRRIYYHRKSRLLNGEGL